MGLPIVDKETLSGSAGSDTVDVYLAQIHVPSLGLTIWGRIDGVNLVAGGQTPAGIERVEGIAVVPSSHIVELDAKTEEGAVWQNLVLARYAKWSQLKLQPIVLQQTNHVADGLVRVWDRPDTGADKHRGYAFQWYALAATILISYAVLCFKRAA